MMRLSAIHVSDNNFPLIGTPIFSNGDGNLYFQVSNDGRNIDSFASVRSLPRDRLLYTGVNHEKRDVGSKILYCVAISKEWSWLGDRDRIRKDILEPRYASVVKQHPFLHMELGYILNDVGIVNEAAKKGAAKIARIAPSIAHAWKRNCGLHPDVIDSIDQIIASNTPSTTELVAIRVSLPEVVFAALDSAAIAIGKRRAVMVRDTLSRHREEMRAPEFLDKVVNFSRSLQEDEFIGRRFWSDEALQHHLLGDAFSSKPHLNSRIFFKVAKTFEFSRSTLRLFEREQVLLFKIWNEQGFLLRFFNVEEFYGYSILYMVDRHVGLFRERLIKERDRRFDFIRDDLRDQLGGNLVGRSQTVL
ncbi:hypothetical protein [Mesorhizobium sp. IMUNJ 23232]|uniref:hypothetical protein n=1 Tax=Mesorhizobium sp. IMUNJ 23232 TaxID=3376064 RepID=UPI00378A29A6